MSKLKFSKSKFGKFIQSKGFYVAIAACLVGAGTATWIAVDRTLNGIETNNNQMIESEMQWNDYPTAEADTKQSGVKREEAILPEETLPLPSVSSSSTDSSSSEPSEPASEATDKSEPLEVQVVSRNLAYALPIKGEILEPYSGGELVKSITLNDWRTHDGVDIAAEAGTDVLAAADGTVSEIQNDPLWGVVVTIDHADGNQSVYCGLDKVLPVKVGDTVMVKQVIGKLEGVPCEIGQPSHLHFAMKSEDQWIDPIAILQKEIVD